VGHCGIISKEKIQISVVMALRYTFIEAYVKDIFPDFAP